MSLEFTLDGRTVQVDAADPHTTLLHWLRDQGYTGTKEGCAEGECGACAVALVVRDHAGRTRYEALNSCLFPLAAAHGHEIVTVQGIAPEKGGLHPVQQAMVDTGGSQCGYCTPGFVVSMFAEYYRPDRQEFSADAIGGNLCRCTGYRSILEAAESLQTPAKDDPRLVQLTRGAPVIGNLTHRSGERAFFRPESLAKLLAVLAEHPDATLICGGTDLMVRANLHHERWQTLISLEATPELQTLKLEADGLVIGAAVTLGRLEDWLEAQGDISVPMLIQLLPLFSSRLIRNRATLGGNLGNASPIGDSAPALLALDAELELVRAGGARRLKLSEFFTGYRATVLQPGELIQAVHIPRSRPQLQRFYKVSKRALDDISTVAAGCALDLDDSGCVKRLRLAFGGIAATPLRATATEALAQGKPWTAETIAELLPGLEQLGTPMSDQRGSGAYRRRMVSRLLEKFFADSQSSIGEAAQ